MTQQEMIEALEPMVDAADLAAVVLALARMCNEKAEHLRVNWQDSLSARAWDHNARKLDEAAARLNGTV